MDSYSSKELINVGSFTSGIRFYGLLVLLAWNLDEEKPKKKTVSMEVFYVQLQMQSE